MVAFFWTINEFKRTGRIEQSFYSAVKIVFAVVCVFFFGEGRTRLLGIQVNQHMLFFFLQYFQRDQ